MTSTKFKYVKKCTFFKKTMKFYFLKKKKKDFTLFFEIPWENTTSLLESDANVDLYGNILALS